MSNVTFTTSRVLNADNNKFSGVSQWQHGATFTITGSAYRSREGKEGEDAFPVLETSVGDLFVSTLLRDRINDKGERLTPNGTLNQKVREIASPTKTNKEVLDGILAATNGKTIVVRRKDYVGMRGDGSRYPASYLEFDIL